MLMSPVEDSYAAEGVLFISGVDIGHSKGSIGVVLPIQRSF